MRWKRLLTLAGAVVMGALLAMPVGAQDEDAAPAPHVFPVKLIGSGLDEKPMLRGLWIDTWRSGMLTREECDELVRTVRDANMNAIFPEVRKVGDAYYMGGFEPRASNLEDDDFDPLGYLIELCHDTSDGKQYIEVHAWLVTFRVWSHRLGETPPEGHLLAEHPDARMYNSEGEFLGGQSVFADPGHPMTEDWTARVFRDVAERYPIDGIHHDYVRYPEYDHDWGHNPVSLARFRERTGFEGVPAGNDPAWQAWRREQVLNVARRVYAEVKEVNPTCVVSAATTNWALEMDVWKWNTSSPRTGVHQDWVAMMRDGYLDMNVLMNYTREQEQPKRYVDWMELAMRTRFDRHAVSGPGVFLNSIDDSMKQIWQAMLAGTDGVCLYSYGGTNNEGLPREAFFRRLREEVFTKPVPPPDRPWLSDPVYGLILGQVYGADGGWVDGASVTLNGGETQLTSSTGFYTFMRVAPGRHSVVVRDHDGTRRQGFVEVELGKAARLNFGSP